MHGHRMLFIMILSLIASRTSSAQNKVFTVRDSIEMSIFIDPETRFGDGRDTSVKFSPDRRHFAVVTTKGNIQSDEIEATLWIFGSEAVRNTLLSRGSEESVVPRVAARIAARTNDAAVISDVRWSSDSRSIAFVGQNSSQGRQLYQVDTISGASHSLTPQGIYVSRYELANGVGVYTAAVLNENLERTVKGDPINSDVRAVTGMPLDAILFPNLWMQSDAWKLHELWTVRNGENVRIIDPASGQFVRAIIDHGLARLVSLSPDGRSVIIIRPMNSWRPEWGSYEPDNPHTKFHPDGPSASFFTYWTEVPAEYALVDLESGKTTSLVNAPLAVLQGYGQPLKADWSPDEKKVLLTATYLPLDGVGPEERSRRLLPCAAVVVEIPSHNSSCTRTMSRTIDRNGLFVRDISFGRSAKEVILHVVNSENKNEQTERYEEQRGLWKLAPSLPEQDTDGRGATNATAHDANDGTLSVFVRQGLNRAPALFATSPNHGEAKKVWEPNPQLSAMNLGEASVLRWKDDAGHRWVAGLIKPPDFVLGKKYPLVIQTHGFVENRFLSDGGYTSALAARPLASAGIVVLQMPYNAEHIATTKELPDNIAGFESAIDLLVSQGFIDSTRIGIIGFSRTCYHVEGALVQDPTRFAAATIADGVDESYLQYLLSSAGTGAAQTEHEAIYGVKPFGEGLRIWMRSAPSFNLDKVKTPLRIEANSGVESVLAEWEIYASLTLQGKPVDLVFFPDGAHVLGKPLERLASQQGNVDWFRFWLKGEEDPDPAKAKQYARWRQLRTQIATLPSLN
jgi:dipeptidyl aminopeptidase/acylaminoacyl peptidase